MRRRGKGNVDTFYFLDYGWDCTISGLSQGMLLPAIAMIFEQEGVSSSINGIHATALYIGILVISTVS